MFSRLRIYPLFNRLRIYPIFNRLCIYLLFNRSHIGPLFNRLCIFPKKCLTDRALTHTFQQTVHSTLTAKLATLSKPDTSSGSRFHWEYEAFLYGTSTAVYMGLPGLSMLDYQGFLYGSTRAFYMGVPGLGLPELSIWNCQGSLYWTAGPL